MGPTFIYSLAIIAQYNACVYVFYKFRCLWAGILHPAHTSALPCDLRSYVRSREAAAQGKVDYRDGQNGRHVCALRSSEKRRTTGEKLRAVESHSHEPSQAAGCRTVDTTIFSSLGLGAVQDGDPYCYAGH